MEIDCLAKSEISGVEGRGVDEGTRGLRMMYQV